MKRSIGVSLWLLAILLGYAAGMPAKAEELATKSTLSENQPATTVNEWMAQIAQSLVQVTGVQVNATETGLEVVLLTAEVLEVAETRVVGNALADIANATLVQREFSQANPIAGIALVSVTSLPNDQVQVTITGTDAPPVTEVTTDAQRLVLAVTLGDADAADEDAIEIVVTGEQDEGYNSSSASTATRTDTPLRDIPQSITVVPQQVLEDRNVQRELEALETISGVVDVDSRRIYLGASDVAIRGFSSSRSGRLRDGLRSESSYLTFTPIGVIERVEVLRGPASVLFGALEPGGVINYVTRQPLDEPYYRIGFEAGNYEFYQPSIDLSGPLTEDESILYRLIAAYQSGGDYKDSTPIVDHILLIMDYDAKPKSFFLQNPLIASLNAVRNNRAYVVETYKWHPGGILGLNRMLDDIFKYLLEVRSPIL